MSSAFCSKLGKMEFYFGSIIVASMYPKNTMFSARFRMRVIRAMLGTVAESDGSNIALGTMT